MKTLKINLISKVILLLFFILVIYFAYKFVSNKKAVETFQSTSRNNRYKCVVPNLVNVNYNKDESDKMVKDYNLKDFTKTDGDFNYLSLIENNQPFDPKNGDCVCEVKQSPRYIWYLNEKRNQILRVRRDKLLNKEYVKIFTNIGAEKKYITAWGVSEDEQNEYCIVFVRDIEFLGAPAAAAGPNKKNYFIIFKANIDTSESGAPINLYNPLHRTPDTESLPDEIYTTLFEERLQDFDVFGDIFIKFKSEVGGEIIFNIFCLNYFDKDFRFGIVNQVKPVACSLSFKRVKGSPVENLQLDVDTGTNYTPISTFKPIATNRAIYSSSSYNYRFSESELFADINDFNPITINKYTVPTSNIIKSSKINEFKKFIALINEYFTKFNENLDADPNKNEGKKINLALTKFIFDNVFDFKLEIIENNYILSLYKNEYSIDNTTANINCELSKIDYKFNFENIQIGGSGGSGAIGVKTDTNNFEIPNINSEKNIVLHNDKYIFAFKRNIVLNKLDEKFKDVRMVGQNKYNRYTDADNSKKQLQTYYNFKYISFGPDNIQGVLEFNKKMFDDERSSIIKSIIYFPHNIYFTLYQNLEKQGSSDIFFGRVYLKDIVKMTSICYPAQKFNFDSASMNTEITQIINGINENDIGATTGAAATTCIKGSGFNSIYKQKLNSRNILKFSLYDFFKDNQTKEGESEDIEKFKNPQDWILLYYMMRISGLYDVARQDADLEELNDNIYNSDLFQFHRDKWTNKHKDILMKGITSKLIYQETSKIDMFSNITIFSKNGSDGDSRNNDEEEVYIHLKYRVLKGDGGETIGVEFSEELNKEEYNFLKLVPDITRNTNVTPEVLENENKIDDIVYNYFKLEQTRKIDVEKGDDDFKLPHIWTKKTINNFEDFKNIVLGTSKFRKNEIDPRDRIRGIYELDTIYVDEYYIDFLKSNNTEFGTKKTIIEEKQKEVDTYCFDFKNNGKKENMLGYPFIVFYKDIDYKGVPCSKNTENKQRIFLCNRVHPGDIKCDQDLTTNIKGRYPLIKQEFLSFSGYGNIIQFYEKKFGGLTNIQTAKLCLPELDNDPLGTCSISTSDPNQNCNQKELKMVNLAGEVKCEVDNPNVKRTEINPIEVLVPGMVDKHACDIYILKGDKKIYFTLGKIFGNVDGELGLSKRYNTVRNQEGLYLFYDNNTQQIITKNTAEQDTPNGTVVPNGFKFIKKFESDKYGNYYLISPKGQEGQFLTSKIDLYQHRLGGGEESLKFSLEGKKNITNRNHLNDQDYYSQKFIVNESLFYADPPEKNQINKEMNEKIEQNRKKRYLEASIYPELAVGDKSYNPSPNDKEKQEMLKELLHNIKRYQRAKNERSSVNLENLGTQLPKAVNETENIIPSRTSIIQKQLHYLHHTIGLDNQFAEPPSMYSKFELPKMDEKEKNMAKKISNNNKDMFTEGQIIEIGSALQKIKDFVPKNTTIQRKPSQCKNLNEGFENMYDPPDEFHNHMVDKYNKYVVKKTKNVDENVTEIKDKLYKKLKSVSNKINDIKLDGKKEQMKLSEEVENSIKLKDTIHDIKEDEQIARMDRMRDKIKEIQKVKCQLGDVNYKKKVKDHPKYNSIMSREDGSFMNIYKIDKKCDGIEAENLNKNMIFINGGCLSYDEEKMRLNIAHCHVDNENQHFNLHQVNDLKGLDDLTIYHNGKDLERPHYVITKNPPKPPQEESGGPSESIYSSDECAYNYAKFNEYNSPAETNGITCDREVQRKLCLHKEDGEISIRKCNNITNQQWDHSDITSHCN